MTSTHNSSLTSKVTSLPGMTSPLALSKERQEAIRKEVAEGMERLRNMPMCKENPELLKPYPERSPEQRELVRKQLVERYSSNPYYQRQAKASKDEASYWSNFSVG